MALDMFKINIIPRTFHFKQPAGTSRGVYTTRRSWLLELTSTTAPGLKGVGECAPLPDLSCDYSSDYAGKLRSFCDRFEAEGEIDYERMREYPSMLFGLETALAHLNAGTTAFFDTPFSRGEEGIPINGLVWMGSYGEMLARMEDKISQGFHCVKLKVGAIDFEKELDLVKRIRDRFTPSEIELRLDANGGFTPDEALCKLELLSQYSVHSIEQPIKPRQWSYMAQLCRESPLPIALDEELIGITDPSMMAYMLNVVRPAYIVLKPSLHGGMYGTRKWIEAAAGNNVGTWITSALESNVALNAIAQLAACVYGPGITMPQGLGTGQLFTDNIAMPIEIRGEKIYCNVKP